MLTEYEKNVLTIIATSEFNTLNGSIPRTVEESATWMWTADIAAEAGLTVNQTKGVLGSLVKKNMIAIDDIDADEDTLVQLTENGIDFFWR